MTVLVCVDIENRTRCTWIDVVINHCNIPSKILFNFCNKFKTWKNLWLVTRDDATESGTADRETTTQHTRFRTPAHTANVHKIHTRAHTHTHTHPPSFAMSLYPSLAEASEQEQEANAPVEPSAPSEHDLLELHAVTQTLQEHGQRLRGMDSASRHHVSNLASSREGTQHLLSELQHRVESDAFLATVEQSRASIPLAITRTPAGEDEEKEDSDWWTVGCSCCIHSISP